MENMLCEWYPMHVLHVTTFWTIPGTLVYHTLKNPASRMLWNEYTGTYRAISTTGTPSILLKKNQKKNLMVFIWLYLLELFTIRYSCYRQVGMVLSVQLIPKKWYIMLCVLLDTWPGNVSELGGGGVKNLDNDPYKIQSPLISINT